MKKTFLQIIFLFVAMVGYAQSDIHFTILKSETKGLSEDVVDALDLSCTRCSTATVLLQPMCTTYSLFRRRCLSTKCCLQTVAW